jgi:sugar phosphate isomerase/epimerase
MIPSLSPVTAGSGLALPQYVDLARRHGFSGVEFSIEEVAQLVEAQGFESVAQLFETAPKVLPVTFGLPVEWRKDEATFREGLEKLPALAKLAQDLDCTRCLTWVLPDSGEPVAEYSARSTQRFGEIGAVLSEQGVRFGLEFLGPAHFRTNPQNVWFYNIAGALQVVEEIEDRFELQNMGLLIDCWHWYTAGDMLMDLAAVPLEKIVHVHINDAPQIAVENQIDNVRLLPGASGVIDIVGFLSTLNALGYDGPVAVETFSEELKTLPPDEAAARAAEAIDRVLQAADIEPTRLL